MVLGDEALDRAPCAEPQHPRLERRLHDAQRLGGLLPDTPRAGDGRRRGHPVQRFPVRVGIRILERPSLEQAAHLLAEGLVGLGPHFRGSLLRMLGELGQHPHERIGDRLVRRVRHRAHDLEDGVHGEPVCRVDRELGALGVVAAHLDQPPQRSRLQRPYQL